MKLRNDQTKHLLTLLEVTYGTGSGQQVVVGGSEEGTADSMWIIRKVGG